jgi:hypothetical protein
VNGSARSPGRLVSGGLAHRRLRSWFRGRLILTATGRLIRLMSRRRAGRGFLVAVLFQCDLLLDSPLFSGGLRVSPLLIGGLVSACLLMRRVLVCRVLVPGVLVCWVLVL